MHKTYNYKLLRNFQSFSKYTYIMILYPCSIKYYHSPHLKLIKPCFHCLLEQHLLIVILCIYNSLVDLTEIHKIQIY